MAYRAHIEPDFPKDMLAVHIARTRSDGRIDVVQPAILLLEEQTEPIVTEPAFYIDRDLGRALYDALDHVLGIHAPDARLAAEVLEWEQGRVDRLIDNLIKLTGGI